MTGSARSAALLISAILAGCGLPDGDYFGRMPDTIEPGHLRFCNSGEPEGLDPAAASSTTAMKPVYLLFDGLTDFDAQGFPEPSLATHWDISDDLRRFTFHMHDRGRWSNGRPITAHDVRYHVMRTLHPSTASVNAGLLEPVRNATLYSRNAVRLVLRDQGGLRAGDIVEVRAVAGRTLTEWRDAKQTAPDSNERRSRGVLALRDLGAAEADAYARVPAGTAVTVLELSGDPLRAGPDTWAYVYWSRGDGVYGWVPWAQLELEPHAAVSYRVRKDGDPREVDVPAAALLMLPEVLGVSAPDDHTVVFETTYPTPWFVYLSASRGTRPTPREAVSRRPRRWTDVEHIVTSGPMHLVTWLQRDKMELVRSPTYWNQEEVRLDRLTMYAIDDQAAAVNLYYTGGCDALTANHVPSSYTRALNGRYQDFRVDPWLGIYFVVIQTEKFPNRHLRRALAYAVDRAQFPKFLHGGQIPSAQYMPGKPIAELTDDERALCGVRRGSPGVVSIMIAGELCYVPPPGLDFDPVKARDELAIAMREMGVTSLPPISFKFNQGSEMHKLIAEYLQHQWQQVLGLDIELEVQEWKTYLSDTKNGEFQLGRFGWIGNFPDAEGDFLWLFRCASIGSNNRSRYCNPAFEAALDGAQQIQDRKTRLEQVYRAEQIMVEDAPIIPLYVYTQIHLTKPYVRDLHINLIDQPPLHEAWLDPNWRAKE